MTRPACAREWANALDTELTTKYGNRVSDQISFSYANGRAAGVALSYDDPNIDDERGVLVSADGAWVVRFHHPAHWWVAC